MNSDYLNRGANRRGGARQRMSGPETALPVADALSEYTQRFVALIREGNFFSRGFFCRRAPFVCGLHRRCRRSRTAALGAKGPRKEAQRGWRPADQALGRGGALFCWGVVF